jgi:MFS family permease
VASTFASLRVRNFAFFFGGQIVSNTGTWFQALALSLVVLAVTDSASALALVAVAQFGPILVLGPIAGRLCDAISPRGILLVTATCSMFVAGGIALAVATSAGLVMIYILVAAAGCLHAFERVASQVLIYELVGAALLQNAVALSTVALSSARSIGPAVAGVTFAAFGAVACMAVNAASFAVILAALLAINPARMQPRRYGRRSDGSFGATLVMLRSHPMLRGLLVVNIVITLTAFNFNVVLTTITIRTFEGTPEQLGLMHTLNAVGAIIGGLVVSSLRSVPVTTLVPACLVFAASLAASALAPTLTVFIAVAPLLGAGLGVYQGVLFSAAQGASGPGEIGRVIGLITLGSVGLAPVSSIVAGAVSDATSGQVPMIIGAAASALCGLYIWVLAHRSGVTSDQ